MLVLTRKKNESIVVDNDVEITVVEIRGDKVRLGIVAPKTVPVYRKEVMEEIRAQPSRWGKLMPFLQAQYEDRRKHGLPWRDPAELRDSLSERPLLPDTSPDPAHILLHVDPEVSPEQLARAYGFPPLLPGQMHAMVWRPKRSYLLFLERKVVLEQPSDPGVVLESVLRSQFLGGSPLLPVEVLLLAVDHADLFVEHGCTAAGAVYGAGPPTAVIEDPDGKKVYSSEKTLAVCQEAYVASLVQRPGGTWGWVAHQGALPGSLCPTAARIC